MVLDERAAAIAAYACGLKFENLPPEVVNDAKRKLIDALGCATGGFHSEPGRIARAAARRAVGRPPARILGTQEQTTPDLAAFANGVCVRVQDYNDSYLARASSHPSDSVSGVLATADSVHASGADVITAVVLAYEVCCSFADALTREQGWDNTFYGVLGSALASGKLLGLDEKQMREAVSLAVTPNVTLAQTRLGQLSMWKGCAAANAVRNGVFAAHLASFGMTGPDQPIEGKWGLRRALGEFSWPAFGGQGHPYRITRTHLKYYPAVVHGQSPIVAARRILEQVKADDIESINIDTYWVAGRYVNPESPLWHPVTRETADHSIPYLVAATLLDGDISEASFDAARVADPAVHALMKRITIRENAEFNAIYPDGWPCRIEAVTKGGKRVSADVRYFKGHAETPLTDDEVSGKFRRLTEGTLDAARGERALKDLWALDRMDDIGAVLDHFVFEEKGAGR